MMSGRRGDTIKGTSVIITAILLSSFLYLPTASAYSWDVYNTENIHRLPTNYSDNAFPDYGPDGKKIVYLSNETGSDNPAIWIMDSDGTNRTILYANKSIDYNFGPPRFSPDGNMICFVMMYKNKETGNVESSLDILIKNASSWNPSAVEHRKIYSMISMDEGDVLFPSWSPDGKKILFSIGFSTRGKNGLWTIDSDGNNLTQILSADGNIEYPSFSPDGSKILYMPFGDRGEREIWIMNSDGTNKHRILDQSWYPDEARFTPDGRIIFSSARVSPHSDEVSVPSIWMMNQDGSDKIMLVPGVFNNDVGSIMPCMSPDMHRFLFFHGLSNRSGLFYIDDPTGEWKDSDGDGVYDGIDGAPDDPYMGYIGENPTVSGIMKNIVPIVAGIIIIASAVISVVYIRKKKGGNKGYENLQKKE